MKNMCVRVLHHGHSPRLRGEQTNPHSFGSKARALRSSPPSNSSRFVGEEREQNHTHSMARCVCTRQRRYPDLISHLRQ